MINRDDLQRHTDIILHPGDLVFDRAPERLRTVLGSCIALTAWHPKLQVGGMCHYLLPQLKESERENNDRYGDIALKDMLLKMCSFTAAHEYELGLFGGARLIAQQAASSEKCVGQLNTAFARDWLAEHHLNLTHEHVGGKWSRTIVLDLSDGSILLKKVSIEPEVGKGGS